jgi:hypothetical protein
MFSPAGGIIYHIRAMLYLHRLWKPFGDAIAAWLNQWQPPEKDIIIIGAGGGYFLTPDFLQRFGSILAVDPDPLSGLIFLRRFSAFKHSIIRDRTDYFLSGDTPGHSLPDLLNKRPEAAVLFSNFLGQIPFLIDDEKERMRTIIRLHHHLLPSLQGRSWCSYHDRYSGKGNGKEIARLSSDHQMTGEELIRSLCDNPGDDWTDHLTEDFFPGNTRYDYFLWRLTPQASHIIEGVYKI